MVRHSLKFFGPRGRRPWGVFASVAGQGLAWLVPMGKDKEKKEKKAAADPRPAASAKVAKDKAEKASKEKKGEKDKKEKKDPPKAAAAPAKGESKKRDHKSARPADSGKADRSAAAAASSSQKEATRGRSREPKRSRRHVEAAPKSESPEPPGRRSRKSPSKSSSTSSAPSTASGGRDAHNPARALRVKSCRERGWFRFHDASRDRFYFVTICGTVTQWRPPSRSVSRYTERLAIGRSTGNTPAEPPARWARQTSSSTSPEPAANSEGDSPRKGSSDSDEDPPAKGASVPERTTAEKQARSAAAAAMGGEVQRRLEEVGSPGLRAKGLTIPPEPQRPTYDAPVPSNPASPHVPARTGKDDVERSLYRQSYTEHGIRGLMYGDCICEYCQREFNDMHGLVQHLWSKMNDPSHPAQDKWEKDHSDPSRKRRKAVPAHKESATVAAPPTPAPGTPGRPTTGGLGRPTTRNIVDLQDIEGKARENYQSEGPRSAVVVADTVGATDSTPVQEDTGQWYPGQGWQEWNQSGWDQQGGGGWQPDWNQSSDWYDGQRRGAAGSRSSQDQQQQASSGPWGQGSQSSDWHDDQRRGAAGHWSNQDQQPHASSGPWGQDWYQGSRGGSWGTQSSQQPPAQPRAGQGSPGS